MKTLKTDLAVTERIAPLVPADVLLISESGISSRADVERLAPIADGFLVGSALMAAPDVVNAARALVHGRVKICGLTRVADVERAAQAGATHAGFIFVPGTPRAVTLEEARPLASMARRHGIRTVGVYRDAPIDDVAATAAALGLDVVQLHGAEDPAEIRKALGKDVEIWGVCADGADARAGADRSLFDTGRGGTGQPFDWARLAGRDDLASGFLAGGIGPANASKAARVGAYGLDIGSAVEARPGEKDPSKVTAFFDALRPTSRGDRE